MDQMLLSFDTNKTNSLCQGNMKEKLPVRPLDILIILLALSLTGFSFFSTYIRKQNTSQVLIQGTDRKWIFPLDAEETVIVPGPLGNTVVRIHDGQVWVESSPCANQVCVAAGHIKEQGLWAACLPNNVIIMIEGSDETGTQIDGYAW